MGEIDKPSIAELMQIKREMPKGQWALTSDDGARATIRLLDAAPLLLEIVAAGKAWQETLGAPRGDRRADAAERELLAALAKVSQ